MGLTHSPTILTNGLVCYMDAGSLRSYPGSGTSIFDVSGRTGTGTLTNGPTFTDNYITLDGTDDSIIFPSSSNMAFGTGNFTVQIMFTASALKGNQYLFDFGSNQFALQNLSGTTFRFLTNNTNIKDVSYTLVANRRYEITITRVGTTGYLYINGDQIGTWSDTDTYTANTFKIGKYGGDNNYNWQGRIYYARVYNVALSQAEIKQNYNTMNKRFVTANLPRTYYPANVIRNGLKLHLDATDSASYPGTGTTWYDLSDNGVNATLVGSPTFSTNSFSITSDSTYITVPNSTFNPRTNDFTYSAWIYYNSVNNSYNTVFENGSWGDTLLFRYEPSGTLFTVYAESARRDSSNFVWSAVLNQWTNIVLRRESNTMTMFINGVATGTTFSMNLDIDLANPTMFLMRSQHAGGQFTSGKIAAFSVYDRALSQTEIGYNYGILAQRIGV